MTQNVKYRASQRDRFVDSSAHRKLNIFRAVPYDPSGVSQYNMTWTQLYEELPSSTKLLEDIRKKYCKSINLPWNFLCDPEGTIIAVSMTPQNLKDKLSEVFGK